MVRAMAAKGIKHTGEIALTPEPGPPSQEIEVPKAVIDEAAKVGVQVNVHAVSTPAMVAAIDAGVRRASCTFPTRIGRVGKPLGKWRRRIQSFWA